MSKAFVNNNLDYTVGKNNNPYLLIQKAGRTKKSRKMRKSRSKKSRSRKSRSRK